MSGPPPPRRPPAPRPSMGARRMQSASGITSARPSQLRLQNRPRSATGSSGVGPRMPAPPKQRALSPSKAESEETAGGEDKPSGGDQLVSSSDLPEELAGMKEMADQAVKIHKEDLKAGRCRRCRKRNWLFTYHKAYHFLEPAIGKVHLVYVIYRWLPAIFFTLIAAAGMPIQFPKVGLKGFLYLTNWSLFVLIAWLWWMAIEATKHYKGFDPEHVHKSHRRTYMTKSIKCMWVLQNIAIDFAFVVPLLYWSLVHRQRENHGDVEYSVTMLAMYTVNFGFVSFDIMITEIPIRFLHMWISILLALVYSLATAIFSMQGGKYPDAAPTIHPDIDYIEHPISSSVRSLMFCFCLVPFVHSVFYGMYRVRRMLWQSNAIVNCFNRLGLFGGIRQRRASSLTSIG